MSLLIVAALVWIAIHLGLAGSSLRDRVAGYIGEVRFRGLFSVLSILALLFLIQAWNAAPSNLWWFAPDWLRWVLVFAMLPAFILFVASVRGGNPTMIGSENAVQPPRGMIRITRHPMLWSFAIWAAVHIIGNGDSAAIVFFGSFLVTALAGMPSIDGKLARRDPDTWQALSATTSILPFAAVAQGRNRLVLNEIGWRIPAIAIVAWALILVAHPWLFGGMPVLS
ncbi:MAG TPA: NnrU family protein [Rhodopila sp.]